MASIFDIIKYYHDNIKNEVINVRYIFSIVFLCMPIEFQFLFIIIQLHKPNLYYINSYQNLLPLCSIDEY